MSKLIYEEAIKVVTYLQEQNSHLKDNCGTIYISSQDITTLENLLIQSHKQEKLLELYKKLNRTTFGKELLEIQEQIKELENE